ncbi:MAG: CBS domain-containing protein [Acidimicrobiales bacterium]
MHIRRILRDKGDSVATIRPDASITTCLATLAEHNYGALVVSVDGAHIDGIISERDIVRALAARGPGCLDESVADMMTTEVITARPGATASELMAMMTARRIRHVPVVDGTELAGIVSIGDIVKLRMTELTEELRALQGYLEPGAYG